MWRVCGADDSRGMVGANGRPDMNPVRASLTGATNEVSRERIAGRLAAVICLSRGGQMGARAGAFNGRVGASGMALRRTTQLLTAA